MHSIMKLTIAACGFLAGALPGCSSDKSSAPDESMKPRIDKLAACTPTDLDVVSAWVGPGFDEAGHLKAPLPEGYVEAVAQGWRKYDAEATKLRGEHGMAALTEALSRDGLIGFESVESAQCDISIAHTLWRDEASMLGFVTSPPHATAMANATKMHHAFLGAHWTGSPRTTAPTWKEGIDRWAIETRADLP